MNQRTSSALARMAAQPFPSKESWRDAERNGRAMQLLLRENGSISSNLAPRRPAQPARRRVLLVAGVTIAAATLGSVTLYPGLAGQTAYAATAPMLRYTPLDAKEFPTNILTDLAARARSQPPVRGSGAYQYIRTQGWYLATDQSTDGRILGSRIEASDREFWVAADGSGRIEETRAGQPTRWSGVYTPGQLLARVTTSGSAESVQATLTRQNPGRTSAAWFEAVKDIWNTQAVSPELQSALLRILAARSDLKVDGTVTDRAGRPGIAVSTRGPTRATRYVLILDVETGMLLDYEEIALEAGDLPVEAPATIGYTLWLASGRVVTTSERP